jgi:hypothetical protein
LSGTLIRTLNPPVIVAVAIVRVMQVIDNQIIHVIAMRNRLVPAVGAVSMALLMGAALVFGRAAVWV